ncbi:MAG: AAA family ATPase [Clostridia bacterium]|nr:AAA family ATPase [Clostridia bacterium]
MKLIQCHIENFGKLANFDYCFTGGLNSIKADNGWGKSTLAAFIKAMFYGLPITNKKQLDENERKKYLPWQGGNFGGNLIFELGKKRYKIERFFDKKSDTFQLYDLTTGKKCQDFTENIGAEIFELDADAFERTIYIPQKALDTSGNESITQRLNHLLHGASEDYNYENTVKRLDEKRILLHNRQKTGAVQTLQVEIEDVIMQMREIENRAQSETEIQKQVTEKDNELANLLQGQNQIQQQINDYGKLQQKQAHQALFAELNRKVQTTQKEIENCQVVFNHHTTSAAEVENYLAVDKDLVAKENNLQVKIDSDYVRARYQTLQNYFTGNIPSVEKTQSVYNDVLKLQALKLQNPTLTGQDNVSGTRKRLGLCFGLVALAVMCAIGGIILLNQQITVAVILLVFCGVALLTAGYFSLVNMINIKTSRSSSFDYAQHSKNQSEILQLQKNIVAFTSQYEKAVDELTAINRIMANLREYEKLQEQMAWNEQTAAELSQVVSDEQSKIENYLGQFKFIETKISRTEKLSMLKQTLIEINHLNQRLQMEKQELAQFKANKNFDVDETKFADIDMNVLQQKERELQAQIDQCRDDKAQLVARINQIHERLAELDDLENCKTNLQNNLQIAEQELSAVKNAIKYLQIASDSLAAKFLTPMKNSLQKHLSLLTGGKFNNLNLDTDFQLTLEEYGQLRTVDFYSRGYQNVFDLCLRFALIDALCRKTKPFIVLDDPFINLDETKINHAKSFLKALVQDHQLFYFTCLTSRC